MRKHADVIYKIIQLLNEGFLLQYTRDKRNRRVIHERCDRIWYSIDRKQLYRLLDQLKLRNLIRIVKNNDGIEKIALSQRARAYSLQRQFLHMALKRPKRWDGRWRLVLFDVPENSRVKRDVLRKKLKEIGFLEFQKSVFVYPFHCRDEINFIINFLGIIEHVFYIEADINPDAKLKRHFKI